MNPVVRLLAAAAAGVLLAPSPALAQFGLFGTNRVQYRHFDWRILRGEHVDLYHYPEEDELARVALADAERAYRALEVRFRHSVPSRIPLIVYASHADFEQTNLLPFVPPEELLGFTEFARSRVAIPFRGNYAEFRHTIEHELVHVFQLSRGRLISAVYPRLHSTDWPLWWGEGLAEYWSAGEDTQDEMILRDLTNAGRLPSIQELNYASGGIVYAIGGALVRFLATRFGEWRIAQMYDDQWKYEGFDQLLQGVFGRSLNQLTAEWHYAMKRKYYPLVEQERPLALDAQPVARSALKPAVWIPPGDSQPEVLFVSPRSGYTDVYAVRLSDRKTRTVVKGERSAQFESFHTFDSRLDVSRSGVLVFGSRYLDRDALFFWDLRSGRMVGRYQFPEIVSILSPAWAPDGRSVAFSGLSLGGYSDLYLLRLADGHLERLTSDRYQDLDPSFSPDGTRIVFSSDRTTFGSQGAQNLFVLDLADRGVRYLTYGNWQDRGPRWSDGGEGGERIVFTSDRRGVQDIYRVDSLGTGRRESSVPGGTFDPVWIPSQGRYVFGGFEDLRFNLYVMRPVPPSDSGAAGTVALALPASVDRRWSGGWRWPELEQRYARAEAERYDRRFQLDVAALDAIVMPGVASGQGATFLLSDQLQDHILALNLATYQQGPTLGNLVTNFNGAVTYVNQAQRLNWGLGAFRFRGLFYDNAFDQVYDETTAGVVGLVRFPLSRFTRLEGRAQLEYSDRLDFDLPTEGIAFPRRRGLLASNYISYVRDNSLWLETGPIDGSRVNLTGGIVNDLSNARFDSWVVSVDARRYLRTSLTSALALRTLLYFSGGERPTRIGLGGTWGLRGYPRWSYVTGSNALLINTEWRFPITDYLTFGFPFGEWRFPGVQGALFADLGRAWLPRLSSRGYLGAYGLGLRMSVVFPLVLRLDMGWRYGSLADYQLPSNYRGRRFVDFWFGFDY